MRRTVRHAAAGVCVEEDVVVTDEQGWRGAPESADPSYAVTSEAGVVLASRARISYADAG